jgi:putative ABC transport system ATP-binding protein
MERRNRPTGINYRPEGYHGRPYDANRMRALQIRQPFTGDGGENTLIFDLPTTGTNLYNAVPVQQMSRTQPALLRRHFIGFVFQVFNLLARTTALENVELPLLYRGAAAKERRRAALQALDLVGLLEWADHTPAELSGGQQQRVAIARALISDPEVLLADEPTGNLDTATGAAVLDLFDELLASGLTLVVVTHDEHAAAHARRVVPLLDGRFVDDVA